MIRPLFVYGSPVLRRVAAPVTPDHPDLGELIADMFETMYSAEGVGLAAPQVGVSIRLFVVDASPFQDDYPEAKGFRRVFINPSIEERSEELALYNEGCLSLPNLREDVSRPSAVVISFLDEHLAPHRERFEGIRARIVQHEYDHLEGVLFVDRLSAIRRQLLRGKLNGLAKGRFSASYRCRVG